MSAYMCDDLHISALAEYAVRNQIFRAEPSDYYTEADQHLSDAEILARKLHKENALSLTARYSDPDDPPFDFDRAGAALAQRATPVEIIVSVNCYQYQSCEHDGWQSSRARQITDAIVDHAIRRLPGHRDARWGAPGSGNRRGEDSIAASERKAGA